MKLVVLSGLLVLLSGCANMTPEQRENFQNALQNYQNNLAIQRQQNIQMQQQNQQQLQQFMQNNRTTNCRTVPVGGGYNTVCN